MNKKKVDSILKGITAAGIAMGGVSSIQGADMVMAAINESAADSNSLVDAGSLSESERTEYSESTTQSMSESASESTSESESVSVSESESTSESSSISESAKQSDAEQQSGDNVVAATYTDDAEQDTAVYARMSGMPQLASNDTYRDGCVSNKVHHVTKITESNYSQYKGDTLFGTKYNLIQTKENHSFGKWEKSSCKYRIQNSNGRSISNQLPTGSVRSMVFPRLSLTKNQEKEEEGIPIRNGIPTVTESSYGAGWWQGMWMPVSFRQHHLKVLYPCLRTKAMK